MSVLLMKAFSAFNFFKSLIRHCCHEINIEVLYKLDNGRRWLLSAKIYLLSSSILGVVWLYLQQVNTTSWKVKWFWLLSLALWELSVIWKWKQSQIYRYMTDENYTQKYKTPKIKWFDGINWVILCPLLVHVRPE